ncbi:MAG TPA: MarP family serine protease [Candidatus Saccharimonadales bacterium]|nr:MarP family serine protease [Candidatus Saccharimonadales bacterium]
MNILDIIIILFAITALYRGYELGLTRQLFSTAGFFLGLLLGSFLQRFTVNLAGDPVTRTLVALVTTLGTAFILLAIGEQLGVRLKNKVQKWKIDAFDRWLGSVVGALTLLVAVWLSSAILTTLPLQSTQAQIRGSRIVSYLNGSLPPATTVLAGLGHLISPNGFPQVFTGNEPTLAGDTTVPGISPQLQQAIDDSKDSVVKFEGIGCGGVVEGTGFAIDSNLIATNAHVVAGVQRPFVRDANGQHSATVVWFDPDLDFAIVRANNLAGEPLLVGTDRAPNGTQGAVLGYPGGGPLDAGGAEVLDHFTARGRDIYNSSISTRQVYSLAARVIPGNSGGPLIAEDGSVIGVIFAQSTAYQNVGYALSTAQLSSAISQARAQNREVPTGACAR